MELSAGLVRLTIGNVIMGTVPRPAYDEAYNSSIAGGRYAASAYWTFIPSIITCS